MNIVEQVTKERILGVLTDGKAEYTKFRNERYVQKSAKLSAKITKKNLPSFSMSKEDKKDKKCKSDEEVTIKDLAEAQRKIEIAELRGMSKADICSYDFLRLPPFSMVKANPKRS